MTTTGLIVGLASRLAGNGVGVWRPDGLYDVADVGIYDTVIPEDVDRLITLTVYTVDADPVLADDVKGVQVRTRMPGVDPRPVRDLNDSIFDLFQGLHGVELESGVHLVSMTLQSDTPLGLENRRWDWSSNFYATVWRPSTNRQ